MINIAELSLTLDNLRNTLKNEVSKMLNQFDYPIIGCKDYADIDKDYRRPIVGGGWDTPLWWINSVEETDCGIILTDEDGRVFNIDCLNTDELLKLTTNLNSVWGIK